MATVMQMGNWQDVAEFHAKRVRGSEVEEILVLIRFFPHDYSDFPALYKLIGQYLFYDVALRLQKSPLRLYIALPEKDYKRLTSNRIQNAAFQDANMRFMPVNLQTGEIQQ